MGKRNKKGGRGGKRSGGDTRDNRVGFEQLEKRNVKLENYYDTILGLSESEKDEFWAALRRELPNSFRFAGSKGHALAVQKLLKTRYIPEITKIAHHDGTAVEPPQPVPWYPDELAWWMTTPKNVVRRFPPFAAFQKYLVSETSVGNISRQEVVSMIPPLLMDIEPGMVVLDMCAAPGSKAAQHLEMVHKGEEERIHNTVRKFAKEDGRAASPNIKEEGDEKMEDAEEEVDSGDYGRTTGLLITNDADYKRSHMLIHQLKRLSSPNLIVTNHDATLFPSIKLPPTKQNPATNRYLKFDRVLADVPCSGDGTCRKNPSLWQDWNPANALGLHPTQVRILVRALQMLKVGGRVVYSTCSMNPVENEAVIVSAIERCGGLQKVQVVDCSDRLPELKRKPGLKTWQIMDRTERFWSSWAEVKEDIEEFGETTATARISESMFPPTESQEQIPLERCMRVYAHEQDTGGFFITVLQKMSEIKAIPESKKRPEMKSREAEAPITAIVDEILAKPEPAPGENVAPKIEAADLLAPPDMNGENLEPTPAARQNEEKDPTDSRPNLKRDLDEDVAAFESTKKLKVKDDVDDLVDIETEEIKEHYPVPPSADIDSSIRPGDMRPNNSKASRRNGQPFEEPFKYISGDHPEVKSIESFYELSPRFPRDRFLVRNQTGEPAKTIYYTSALIREILEENEGRGMKFVHGGVKMFMKQDVQGEGICKWRIQSDGMPLLEGYVGENRIVRLYKKSTFRALLVEMFPKVADGAWENLGEIGERVRDMGMGCCVLRIEKSDDEDGFDERMVVPLWRSAASLNLMLSKEDRSALLLRLFNDTTPLVNNSHTFQKKTPEVEAKEEPSVASGFKSENGEIKVDVVSEAIEGNGPVEERSGDIDIKEGPYGEIVGAKDAVGFAGKDAQAVEIERRENVEAGFQLNGTAGAAE